MITKDKIKAGAMALMLVTSFTSCADWLSVDMEDSIMENKLYETNEGFLSSLNGVYAKMNENYSSTLTMGAIDVMAQYYDVSKNSTHTYYAYANYQPEQFKSTSNALWTTQYELIANLNTLLEHCDEAGSALNAVYYPYVKGEALALRAFLHFDLMRVYGPIYRENTAETVTIPYAETSSKEIQPLLSAKTVMEKVIRDLSAAADLLKDDRIRTEGVLNGVSDNPNENTNLRYRQYRVNYFAVQALLARAYLWIGDKEKAYQTAKGLIAESEEKEIFPWTKKAAVTTTLNPDLLFSSEVIFSLYNTSRTNLFDRMFNRSVNLNSILCFQGETLEEGNAESKLTYYFDDMGDLRREYMWKVEEVNQSDEEGGTVGSHKVLCLNKYEGVTAAAHRYMIPLVRMSEIYLIAAECTDDLEEAVGYVNAIRAVRNCVNLTLTESDTKASIQEYITNEFMREVIGEGQLFFYYKRHAMPSILAGNGFKKDWSGNAVKSTVAIDMQNYVWPMPEVEMDKRVVSE